MPDPSDHQDTTYRRREPRCGVDRYRDIPGHFMVGPTDATVSYPCRLVDLSENGCSITLEDHSVGEPRIAIVRFEIDDQLKIESAGRVCWSKHVSIGTRSYGIRFRRPLDSRLIEAWIEVGLLNRRERPRNDVREVVTVQRADSESKLDAAILDYSQVGLQVESNLPLAIDERILVHLSNQQRAIAQVVWSATIDGRCCSGCTFVNRSSSEVVADYFENREVQTDTANEGFFSKFRQILSG